MKKLYNSLVFKFIIWRVVLIFAAFLAITYIPIFSDNFFGGKYINYSQNPLLWTWANFDGEHYLSIAQNGYKSLQQAFFPLYPLFIRFFAFGGTSENLMPFLVSGLILSNLFFLVSLFFLEKVINLDYDQKTSNLAVLLLLFFPTSFFFGGIYTESLFFLLSLATYYFYRKERYFLSLVFGILTTLTRFLGLFVILMIVIDLIVKKTSLIKIIQNKIYLVFLSGIGLFGYMYYCFVKWGDALAFFNLQTLSGEQRSTNLILLPQVFYRYFAKIIPNLNFDYFPFVFTIFLEISIATLFLILLIFSFKKVRWDYWFYMLSSYMIPTLTGSFSSLPRYVLVIFPTYIVMASYLKSKNKFLTFCILAVLAIISIIAQSLFVRGYFIS